MRYVIIGLGTQKSATTFIYKSIQKDSYYISPLTKEFHTFDTYYFHNNFFDFKTALIQKLADKNEKGKEDLYRLVSFMNNPENYYNYFDHILPKDQHSFSSDITPSYCLLNERQLFDIKNNFQKKGINVKVVFNMREPITRLYSAIKMIRRRKNSALYNFFTELDKDALILKLASGDLAKERVNYMQIYKNITNVFDSHEYLINLYETMFTQDSLKNLSYFLFNGRKKIIENKKYNASPHFSFKSPFKASTIKLLMNIYEEHYEFCESIFPGSKLLWKQACMNLTI